MPTAIFISQLGGNLLISAAGIYGFSNPRTFPNRKRATALGIANFVALLLSVVSKGSNAWLAHFMTSVGKGGERQRPRGFGGRQDAQEKSTTNDLMARLKNHWFNEHELAT